MKTHNMSSTKTYKCWSSMLNRCRNPKCPDYANYGGRGITVCDYWNSFENFYKDMGDKPEGTSIDRINNDGNYEKENCRWATRSEQRRNQGNIRMIEYQGKTMCLRDWTRHFGLKKSTVDMRVGKYGWDVIKAITTPSGVSYRGENCKVKSLKRLAEERGICRRTLVKRIYELGWTVEKALNTPPRKRKDRI